MGSGLLSPSPIAYFDKSISFKIVMDEGLNTITLPVPEAVMYPLLSFKNAIAFVVDLAGRISVFPDFSSLLVFFLYLNKRSLASSNTKT